MAVKIGRIDEELKNYAFVENETLNQFCTRINLSLSETEKVQNADNGSTLGKDEVIENDVEYYIVKNVAKA